MAAAKKHQDLVTGFSVKTDRVFTLDNGQIYAIVGKNEQLTENAGWQLSLFLKQAV